MQTKIFVSTHQRKEAIRVVRLLTRLCLEQRPRLCVCARTCDEDTAEEGFGTVCELVLPLRLFVRMKRHEGDVDQHQSAHQQVEAHGPHYLCVHVECVRHVCISGRHDPKPTPEALPKRAHAGEDGRRGQYRTPKEVGGDVRVRGE